jgi:hypothetical protein
VLLVLAHHVSDIGVWENRLRRYSGMLIWGFKICFIAEWWLGAVVILLPG